MKGKFFRARAIHPCLAFLLVLGVTILSPAPVLCEKGIGTAPTVTTPPRLVNVGAAGCSTCRLMVPVLEEIGRDYGKALEVVSVDVWKNPIKAVVYRVRMIPAQIFYDRTGKEVFRHSGFYSRDEILRKLDELHIPLKKTVKE